MTILRRAGSAAVTLLIASVVIFELMRLAPGDPVIAMIGTEATPEQLAAVRAELHLNDPVVVQYGHWMAGLLTGNLGRSFQRDAPIAGLIEHAMGSTVQLAIACIIALVAMGLIFGVLLTLDRRGWVQKAADLLSTVALSMPAYVTAILVIFVFAVQLKVLPPGGELSFFKAPDLSSQYLLMPAFAVSLPGSAVLGRLLATEIRRTRQEEFILTAIAKGVPPRKIERQHVLPGSLTPFIVELGIAIGDLLGGAVIAEALFARNGLGKLLIDAVSTRDYPLAQTLMMMAITVAILAQLVSEAVLAKLDPRIGSRVAA